MTVTPTRPPYQCTGCGRYTTTREFGGFCPRCAPLARWLESPQKYPPLKTDPEKFHEPQPV